MRIQSGDTFGHWTIISSHPVKWNGTGEKMWECDCNCGTVKYVNEWNLKAGKSTNCGCVYAPCEGGHKLHKRAAVKA